jgi:hypothetical protein
MNSTTPGEVFLVPNENVHARNTDDDRFLVWPIVLSIGFPIVLVFAWIAADLWSSFVLLAAYLLWWGGALLVFIVMIGCLLGRQWRKAVSALVLPATAVAAVFNLHSVGRASIWAGDRLELLATLPTYSWEIANLPHKEGPRIATFLWRDLNLGFGLALGYEFLVYDDSDEIALPAQERSAAWRENAGSDLECRLTGVEHVFGHYYFVGHGNDCQT